MSQWNLRIEICETGTYSVNMAMTIQLRNVPNVLHRKLNARAGLAGMSLSDYLLAQVREIAERPTLEEMVARLRQHEPVKLSRSAADLVRAERDSH